MSDYSLAAKALHHMALGTRAFGRLAFDLERSIFLNSSPRSPLGPHVFVVGLARAGTTILMRALYGSGQFASLTYEDMPFVLCPNMWSRFSRSSVRTRPAQERAHGDGIFVDVSSPEALDEVFWRVFAREPYIKDDGLYPYAPCRETVASFREYIRLVMRRRQKTRYLSKNNNNILRIQTLWDGFPDAVFLLPIREPVSHAQSLLAQHRRFLDADRFTVAYMGWLGHHEFGKTHRPFVLGPKLARGSDPSELDYWVEQWIQCYSYLDRALQDDRERVYFVPYESLCEVAAVWNRIEELTGIEGTHRPGFKTASRRAELAYDTDLATSARQLYTDICQRALHRLGIRRVAA